MGRNDILPAFEAAAKTYGCSTDKLGSEVRFTIEGERRFYYGVTATCYEGTISIITLQGGGARIGCAKPNDYSGLQSTSSRHLGSTLRPRSADDFRNRAAFARGVGRDGRGQCVGAARANGARSRFPLREFPIVPAQPHNKAVALRGQQAGVAWRLDILLLPFPKLPRSIRGRALRTTSATLNELRSMVKAMCPHNEQVGKRATAKISTRVASTLSVRASSTWDARTFRCARSASHLYRRARLYRCARTSYLSPSPHLPSLHVAGERRLLSRRQGRRVPVVHTQAVAMTLEVLPVSPLMQEAADWIVPEAAAYRR